MEVEQTSQGREQESALGDDLADRILAILPKDGSRMSNPEIRSKLGIHDDDDEATEAYWSARNSLIDRGLAARDRGQGGSTMRVLGGQIGPNSAEVDVGDMQPIREDELYDPLLEVLRNDWQADKGYEYLAVENVSKAGRRPTGGKWTRPDLVAVQVEFFDFLPQKILTVHSFEVKAADAIDVTVVYEALGHRRSATHAYALLHVPDGNGEPELEVVFSEARRHGVGIIVFEEASDYATWEERVIAERVEPEPSSINDFIKIQLSEETRNKVSRNVR